MKATQIWIVPTDRNIYVATVPKRPMDTASAIIGPMSSPKFYEYKRFKAADQDIYGAI